MSGIETAFMVVRSTKKRGKERQQRKDYTQNWKGEDGEPKKADELMKLNFDEKTVIETAAKALATSFKEHVAQGDLN